MSTTPDSKASPIKITESNFESEVLQSDRPVLIDFWADWCRPCHMLAPTIEKLAADNAGRATIGKLDVDENPEIAGRFGIRSIPTVLLFKQGKVVESLIGVQPAQAYEEALSRHLEGS